jgi:hypothetical protein
MVQTADRDALAYAISASVASGLETAFCDASHGHSGEVQMYVCVLLGRSTEMEAWQSHVSVVRLVCIPNGRIPLPVRRQCLRSAANKAAGWLASRGPQFRMATTVNYCALLARGTWVVTGVVHAQRWISLGVATGFWLCWCRLLAAVCRAVVGQSLRGDLPLKTEATRRIVWWHAVLLKQAASLSRWRQANRLRVRDMAFLFAPRWCYRTASHKPGPGRHTHDVQAHACSSRACHMSKTSRALGSKRAAGWQEVGGSGAMRMQLNVCRGESIESCLELELAGGEDAIYLPPIP